MHVEVQLTKVLTKLNFYKSLHKSVSLSSCFHFSLRMWELARREYNTIVRFNEPRQTDSTFHGWFTANQTTSFSHALRLKGLIYLQFATTKVRVTTFLSSVNPVSCNDCASFWFYRWTLCGFRKTRFCVS